MIFFLVVFLLILFYISLPFYLYHKKKKENSSHIREVNFEIIKPEKFMFMDDYRMWKNLTEEEKKERLTDIQVIFNCGKEHITKEMIKKGFKPESKIIDIKYFSGLSEHGFTIITFLIQHKDGGEIRALTLNIDLNKMEFRATSNFYFSSGKERYYYLKNKKLTT